MVEWKINDAPFDFHLYYVVYTPHSHITRIHYINIHSIMMHPLQTNGPNSCAWGDFLSEKYLYDTLEIKAK